VNNVEGTRQNDSVTSEEGVFNKQWLLLKGTEQRRATV